jgi:hypothetical protein
MLVDWFEGLSIRKELYGEIVSTILTLSTAFNCSGYRPRMMVQ